MTKRAIVSLLLLLASGCSNGEVAAQRPAPPIPVRLEPVDRTPIRETLVAPGLVHPRDTYELGFPMGGLVLDVLVEQGAEVRAGDELARLDATTARATATQAREGLSRAERELERARLLAEGGSLATAMLEDAETGTNVARASLAAAAFAARHSVLRAPADGWVDLRNVDPGEIVGAGQPLFRIASRGRGWVLRVAVPDRVVARIATGDSATLTLDALPRARLAATIVEIARTPTPGFGTFDVQVHLDEVPEGVTLRTGLVGRASLPYGDTHAASVPLSALVDGHDHDALVFVVADGRARSAPIHVAFMTGDRAALADGLPGIDAVVTAGADRLVDGARVVPSEE